MPESLKRPSGSESGAAKRVIVTLNDAAMGNMKAVAKQLEKAGLAVKEILEITGQVIGDLVQDDLEPLRRVEGVVDVSESRDIQLPPPDSGIQ